MQSRTALFGALALALLMPISAMSQTHVNGYTKRDGTYVAPHYRSSPNSTRTDNYSTRGNVNPYTGEAGTKDPYAQPQANGYAPASQPPNAYGNDDDQDDDGGPQR